MLKLDLDSIQEEIKDAGHGNRGRLVEQYASLFGVSKDKFYRMLRVEFGKQKTLNREKKHADDVIKMIAKIKEKGRKMALVERELSTQRCIRMLVDNGITGADDLRVSTVNRRLAEAGYRDTTPRVLV